jgi:hypothetical protein
MNLLKIEIYICLINHKKIGKFQIINKIKALFKIVFVKI